MPNGRQNTQSSVAAVLKNYLVTLHLPIDVVAINVVISWKIQLIWKTGMCL